MATDDTTAALAEFERLVLGMIEGCQGEVDEVLEDGRRHPLSQARRDALVAAVMDKRLIPEDGP